MNPTLPKLENIVTTEGIPAIRPIPILMYHSVSDRTVSRFRRFTVPPVRFTEQLRYLKKHDYTTLTVSELHNMIAGTGTRLPERVVVLTFDDAFADFHSDALPALVRHGFRATLYIPTAFIGGTSQWLARDGQGDRPVVTWPHIYEIASHGIECGAHSHTHRPLDMLTDNALHEEIAGSRALLGERLGVSIESFAYPFGYYNARVQRATQEAGFSTACAVDYHRATTASDPYALPRILIGPDTSMRDFAMLLAGANRPGASIPEQIRSKVWRTLRQGGNIISLQRSRRNSEGGVQ